jgi:parvulin-like peptidyl-prolyl isomerase
LGFAPSGDRVQAANGRRDPGYSGGRSEGPMPSFARVCARVGVPLVFLALGASLRELIPEAPAAAPAVPLPVRSLSEPGVLATVNAAVVTVDEFITAASRKTPANGTALSTAEKREILDGLVEEVILYEHALIRGLDKDPKVKKVVINLLVREDVYSTVNNSDFTDEQLQAYYEGHKDEFVVPEKVQIRTVTVKVTDARSDAKAQELANQLHTRITANPEGMKDLATEQSEDPYRRRGGDVGFVARVGKPGLDQAIVDLAFDLKEGEVARPIRVGDAWVIVATVARREQVERTFQQMKGSVLRKVKNDKMKQLYDVYVARLRQGASIRVDEKELEGIVIAGRPATSVAAPVFGGDTASGP